MDPAAGLASAAPGAPTERATLPASGPDWILPSNRSMGRRGLWALMVADTLIFRRTDPGEVTVSAVATDYR